MRDEIQVQVEGPTLLRRGIGALLSTYRGIGVIECDSTAMAPLKSHGEPDALLVIAVDRLPEEFGAAHDRWSKPILTLPSPSLPVSLAHVALLTGGAESELVAACARGVSVLLSIHDNPCALHRGVLSAARGEAYCSPALTSRLVHALQRTASRRHEEVGVAGRLSDREREVARLAAAGASNEEISERLFITVRTVKAHLTEVFRKLDIKRRGQIHGLIHCNGAESANSSLLRYCTEVQ
jgi:DNA-binding NarL/FixJ family response regulator